MSNSWTDGTKNILANKYHHFDENVQKTKRSSPCFPCWFAFRYQAVACRHLAGQSSVRTGKTVWPRSPLPLWGVPDGSKSCEASPSPGPHPKGLWVLQGSEAVEAGSGFQVENLMGPEGCIHPGKPAEGRLCTGSAAYLNKGTNTLVNAAQRWHTNDSRYWFTEKHATITCVFRLRLPFVYVLFCSSFLPTIKEKKQKALSKNMTMQNKIQQVIMMLNYSRWVMYQWKW